jgi:hypothetical protein
MNLVAPVVAEERKMRGTYCIMEHTSDKFAMISIENSSRSY